MSYLTALYTLHFSSISFICSSSRKVQASSDEERVCRCDLEFTDEAAKAKHMIKFHNKFKCPECPMTFGSTFGLRYHMQHAQEKHQPDYGKTTCSICGARFKSFKFLKEHKKSIHKTGEKRSCPYCGEMVHDVRKHIRQAHNNAEECEVCGKKVKNLENHFLTVHGADENKRFRCETCGKGFVLKEKMIAHQVVHSEERPFRCKHGCGFAAKTLGNCKKHEESKHTQKRLYVDGKPQRKKRLIKNYNSCEPDQSPCDPTPAYNTRFKVVKDEILSEEDVKPELVMEVDVYDDLDDYEPVSL